MRAISRYVFLQLLAVTLAVTATLTLAVWLVRSLRLIDYIVNRGLPVDTFLWMVFLLLPTFLGVVLPISAFCAVLFIYNRLTLDSEMVVMRAAGLSQWQLALPALLVALGVTALGYSITLYFQPVTYKAFADFRDDSENDLSALLLQDGAFSNPVDGITVYVRERGAEGELHGILFHDGRDPEHPVTMTAEHGALLREGDGPRVVMLNGSRQQMTARTGRLSVLEFDRYTLDLGQLRESAQRAWPHRKELFLHELLFPERHIPAFQQQADSDTARRLRDVYLSEAHQRLATPLSTLSFVLIGLGTLLSGRFNRRGQYLRIAFAIVCVAALQGALLAARDIVQASTAAAPALYAAVLAPLCAGLYAVWRGPRPRTRQRPLQGVAAS